MLRRDDDARGAHRLAVDIFQRHLAFGIRPQQGQFARVPVFGNQAQDFMRVENRRRHKARRFAAGIAEHDALIARAFILVAGRIDAHRDIVGLRVNIDLHIGPLPVKAFLRVADFAHGVARGLFHLAWA